MSLGLNQVEQRHDTIVAPETIPHLGGEGCQGLEDDHDDDS